MQLIPAIDLLDGRVVRLIHGDFDQCQVYADHAEPLAQAYNDGGAKWLHVVDLVASRDGVDADTGALFRLLHAAPQSVQTGGGVRQESDVAARLAAGAQRVVIGSLCVTDTQRFVQWLQHFGAEQLVAAVDVRFDAQGVPRPRIHGWTEAADTDLWRLLDTLVDAGLRHALVTDIGRDGTLAGPNTALYQSVVERYPGLSLQASGGVASLDDLGQLRRAGASGAITGKALLEQRFTLQAALEAVA